MPRPLLVGALQAELAMSEEVVVSLLQTLVAGPHPQQPSDGGRDEKEILAKFCHVYQNQRCFSQLPHYQLFKQLLLYLKQHRVTMEWLLGVANEGVCHSGHTHTALMSLRLLLRDEKFQHLLMTGDDPLPVLVQALSHHVQLHFSSSLDSTSVHTSLDQLKELTNIFQKLSNTREYRQRLVASGVHCLLVQLLESHDLVPLQCSLCALINLSKTESVSVAALPCAPPLLHIISSYDTVSRHLASDLLLLLSQQSSIKEQIRDSDGLPQCLRILHSQDQHLLHRMVGVVEHLLDSTHCQEDVRLLGGIPLLLALLRPKGGSEVPPQQSKHGGVASHQGKSGGGAEGDKEIALRAVCCSALTQLVLNDANAQLIMQGNGVYLISCQLLPLSSGSPSRLRENLQRYALRALRYLFSVERNRKVFKMLFPPNLFEIFIDIGHYNRDLSAYSQLVHTLNTLPESEAAEIGANIEAANQNKAPIFSLGGYAVLELLGSGAFGSVYKVRKQNSQVLLALKEIRCTQPLLGHTPEERSTSIGRLLNEVNMIREHLHHPNIVKYHKCFQEGEHLYIVMELLEGAPLSDHVSSLAERGSKFSEGRLWKLYLQLVLGLRYLHKEKGIVHRDLSPANLMISQDDKLTITDFGLAKQKRELSVLKSVVGTVLYWCPELVQSEPYNEKADVWASGCLLYLMATLRPPFHSTNLLTLAKKIAEVEYEAIPEGSYSPLVSEVVTRCLTADPQQRPDIVQVGGLLSGVLMQHMDTLTLSNHSLHKKLDKEKQKTLRHYQKAVSSETRYQQLLSSSSSLPAATSIPTSSSAPSLATPIHARRQLSSAFEAMANTPSFSDNTLATLATRPPVEYPTSASDPNLTSMPPTQSTSDLTRPPAECPDLPDPLQISSDSVFMESLVQDRLLSNSEQPASPQVVLRTGSGRPRPPASRNSIHAPFSSPGENPPRYPITRKASLPTRKLPCPPDWGAGPLSPLAKVRTPSASSTLSISPKHLREISDPILAMLTQLHKLLYVTQQAPPLTPSACWTLLQRYRRALFAQGSTPSMLKTHLHRLVSASTESVEEGLGVGPEGEELMGGVRLVQCAMQEMEGGATSDTLTYETLEHIIEALATEHGYYRHRQQTTPTGHTHQSSA